MLVPMGRPRTVPDDAVFAAIATVVSEHGPSGTTLARVANVVGLTPAALVQRFGSKHALLVAFAHWSIDETTAIFERERPGTTPLMALLGALRDLSLDVHTPTEMANHLAFLPLDLVDPDLRPAAVRQGRIVEARVRSLIEEAVAAGELVSCDSSALAATVYTTWNGAQLTWALHGRGTTARWASHAIGAVLRPYRTASPGDASRPQPRGPGRRRGVPA